MRVLKILFTGLFAALALIAGLFIAFFGVLAIALGRLLGRSSGVRTRVQFPGRPQPRPKPETGGDVIEVTATEVPADSLPKGGL